MTGIGQGNVPSSKTRDKPAALRFLKKALKRHGQPEAIATDGLVDAVNERGIAKGRFVAEIR